jgi:hypothetical protein
MGQVSLAFSLELDAGVVVASGVSDGQQADGLSYCYDQPEKNGQN